MHPLRLALLGLAGLALAAAALVALAEEAEAAPTYRVWATREGLVGYTTANGHVIQPRDHFVALPTREALSSNGGHEKQVRVCNPANGRCETAPVWDVGPWNIHDDYWNPGAQRDIYAYLDHGGACCLAQGKPEAQAAYESGYNGGRDEFGRTVLNRAGIDLADGTFWDGLQMSTNGWVDVTFLWVADPPPSDTAKPETTPTLAGTAGLGGWYTSPVTVKLAAADTGGSGVDFIQYRIDLGAWKTYTGAFTLSADGARRVDYYAVDKAGNREATETITVKIDEVPPATSHAFAGTPGTGGWFRSAVTVSLGASDATSGVATTSATRDGAAFTYTTLFSVGGEGIHALTYRSRDVAGNWEVPKAASLRIDTVAPSTAMSRSGPAYQGAQLYVSSATVFTLAAADATSGVKGTARTWQGATVAYAGPFSLGGPDGAATLAWRSEDQAGNVESSRSQGLFLDNTPPTLSIQAPPDDGFVVSLEPVQLAADAADVGSGVARVEFLVDGVVRATDTAAPYGWAWPAGDEALGEHSLEVRAVDRLGHATSVERTATTVPTSVAGVQATAARVLAGGPADPALPAPPRLPVLGLVAEADPATGEARVGVLVDDAFVGVEV